MARDRDRSAREFIWQKVPKVSRAREIVIDGETWVRILRVKVFGSLASVESKAGAWTLKRVGWFRTRISIRAAGTETDLAIFTPSWAWFGSSGALQFEGRSTYFWGPTKSYGREHSIAGPDRNPLLRFRGGPGKCRMAFVSSSPEPRLPLLAALGYYLIQLTDEDAGVIAAIAGAAAAG